jgi:cell division protein YceG involved in septum cleavage
MTRTANMMIQRDNFYWWNRRRIWTLGVIVLILLLLFSAFFFSKTVTAQRNIDRTKFVTSVEIKKGDTLWSIASEYISDEYGDMNEYISEIKDSNGMVSDTINVGSYLIIPYYADASR